MLLPLPQISLMEDELEEGEIIEIPLLVTPTNYKDVSRDNNQIKNAKPLNPVPDFRFEKRLNGCKTHVCKWRKKNVKQNVSKKDSYQNVRVVKYKVNPNDYKSTKVRGNSLSAHKFRPKCGNLPSVNSRDSTNKRRSYPKQYRDLFEEQSDYEVDDPSYEDLLTQYKALQSKLKVLREDTKEKESTPNMSPSINKSLKRKASKLPEEPKVSGDKKSKSSPSKKPKIETIEIVDDDDENEDDLEFLRQIALASRSKPSSDVMQCNGDGNNHLNEDCSPFHSGVDNYEVVDMEFSDTDDTIDVDQEILSEQDLNTHKNSILQENINNDYNEDFSDSDNDDNDLLMLRAKLLEEMKEKQKSTPVENSDIPNASNVISDVECLTPSQDACTSIVDIDSSENIVSEMETLSYDLLTGEDKIPELEDLPCEEIKLESGENMSHLMNTNNFNIETSEQVTHSSNLIVSNASQHSTLDNSFSIDTSSQQKECSHAINSELLNVMDKENVIKQDRDFHLSINESLLAKRNFARKKQFNVPIPRELVKPLIIKLGQSSESESENDTNENESGNDMLASLEKLIENAKNNVDDRTEEEAKEVAAILHGNEDYNVYSIEDAKLEAQKKKEQINIFNDLLSSLRSACSTYKDDEQLYSTVKLQANKRKGAFVASQVEITRLRELLAVAVKTKNDNKKSMYTANARLAAILKAMNKKRSLIALLRKECTKMGMQIFGLNYTLPNFETNSHFNRFKLRQRNS